MSLTSTAVSYWAAEADCADIEFLEKSDFSKVWVYSIMAGLTICIVVTVPYTWCQSKRKVGIHPDASGDKDGAAVAALKSIQDGSINFEEAKSHLICSSATIFGKWQNPCCTRRSKINTVGGTGTELYFKMLTHLGFMFAYMSALTAPLCAFNLLSNFAPDTGQFLVKTSLGNLGQAVPSTILDPVLRILRVGCQGALMEDLTPYFAWCDFLATIFFLGYILHFRFSQIPRSTEQDDRETISVSDFAIVVDCLPPKIDDQRGYETLLAQLIESRVEALRARQKTPTTVASEIQEVTLVRDYGGRLRQLKWRAELLLQIEIAKAYNNDRKVDKLTAKLEKLDTKLAAALPAEQDLPVVRAFVILNSTRDVDNLLFDYRFAEYSLLRCCQSGAKCFQGKPIRVRRGPPPTDILWDNQDTTFKSRLLRKATMALVFIICLSISIASIFVVTAWARSQSDVSVSRIGAPLCDPVRPPAHDSDKYQCFEEVARNWTRSYAVNNASKDELNCWCTAQGYQKMMDDRSVWNDCQPWLESLGRSIGTQTGASVIVVLINVVCQAIFAAMSQFERHLSQSCLNSSLMMKVFLAQSINTGFVLFLVNLNIEKLNFRFIFGGPFDDLTRGWYSVVGVVILTNMLINIFVPPGTNIAKSLLTVVKRCCCSRVKHQAELLKLYTNPEFDIKQKFAQMLTVVFVTVTYSSGLPLLNVFAFFYMLCMYWADKFVLLWGSKRPPRYDSLMAKEASEACLYAVALHCVFAIAMYGQPCAFPSKAMGGQFESLAGNAAGSNARRLTLQTTWMFTALLAVLGALWVLWWVVWILGGSLGSVLKLFTDCCCASVPDADGKDAPVDVASTKEWKDAAVIIERTFPPASFSLERHPDMATTAHLIRQPFSPKGDAGLPVPEANAQGFAQALDSQP
eukprot:TRINITY_DN14363_c0_g1_i2.p1 TRINITY_DN14363_c0_g1~~TRINITY_DN14363_c0_g1_i2.p1  ORF type:complete len:913 (-),score=124.97 TRINITY_DN14363_c0_g1_i2:440-3178(-)